MEKYFDLPGRGFTIRCKVYYRGESFRHVILFCHGFAGHKDNEAANRLADRILAAHDGFALVIFNLPAHGDDSHQEISLADCGRYLDTVIRFIRQTYQPEIFDACGTSFGGYLLLKYISDHGASPFRRICLRCPAVVMYDVLADSILTGEELELLLRGGKVPAGFDRKVILTKEFMEDLKDADITARDFSGFAPILCIVQGTADELIPFAAAESFALTNGIRFLPVEGADHRFLTPGAMDIVIETFTGFLNL